MSVQTIRPTDLPAGHRRTVHVDVTMPAPTLFTSQDGGRWRLAGIDADGGRLFVPGQINPAKCPRWIWSKETELVDIVGTLTPLAVSA